MVYHEQAPKYDLGFWLLVSLFPVGFVIGGLWYYTHPEMEDATVGAITFFGLTIFWVILFWAIILRKYHILNDRVKIILGGPFSLNIPFDSIKQIEYPTKFSASTKSGNSFVA